jgi:hypothetical protein
MNLTPVPGFKIRALKIAQHGAGDQNRRPDEQGGGERRNALIPPHAQMR